MKKTKNFIEIKKFNCVSTMNVCVYLHVLFILKIHTSHQGVRG